MPTRTPLVGQRFGRLVVAAAATLSGGGDVQLCRCDCGGRTWTRAGNLRSGMVLSCGCLRREKAAGMGAATRTEMVGLRFGRLVVVSRGPTDKHRTARWLCRCDCGREKVIGGKSLRLKEGGTRSCGCLRKKEAPADE